MKKIFALVLVLALTLGLSGVAFAAYDNPYGTAPTTIDPVPGQPYTADLKSGELDPNIYSDNGIGNANASGNNTQLLNPDEDQDPNNVIKSKGMLNTQLQGGTDPSDPNVTYQRTHGAYQNNTNSCASCHQTHTGASKDLLIKAGVYNTCTACHDGTLGFYNVFKASTAGTFGGTEAGNASVHLANGTLLVNYAPGYDDNGLSNEIATDNFDCASCHAPHGSYSSRLLHYSPNGMADIPIENKGNKLVNKPVDSAPAALPSAAVAADPDFKVVRGPASVAGVTLDGDPDIIYVLKKEKLVDDTDPLNPIVTYQYVRDTNPWVAGYEHAMNDDGTHLKNAYYTEFFNGDIKVTGFNPDGEMNDQLTPIYGLAYATGTAVDTITKANIARAYVVELAQTTIAQFGKINITEVDTDSYDEEGKGIAISKYCGACHTNYMTHSGDAENSGVYRHSTDKDRFNCLKCHFAHGTDVTVMKDARDRDVAYLTSTAGGSYTEAQAKAYLLDKNPSSALKRYTNMAVCWKCHSAVEAKSSKLMNNTEYWTNYDTNPIGGNNPAPGAGTYQPNWLNNDWE